MNQDETSLLRKVIFLSIAILAAVLSVARVQPAFAQIAPANFDAVDDYISSRMKELGIPGAALVIVQGDQIVHLAMGWEVQHFQDVEVIRHNGASPGYTTDMFLVPQKNIAIAMVMNTYSPILGVRVQRVPSSVLRMLLGQVSIPGFEFRYMQIVYAGVMLIPWLHLIAVFTTFRRIRYWRTSAQHPTPVQAARFTALTLIWNVVVAYILLVLLPVAFNSGLRTVILFQPDVGWMAVMSGIFAMIWGVISSSIGISMLRHTLKRPEIA